VPSTLTLGGRTAVGFADPASEFKVRVLDFANNPVLSSAVDLRFSDCAGVRLCADQPDSTLHVVSCSPFEVIAITNFDGYATFHLVGSSSGLPSAPCAPAGCLRVYADGVLLRTVSVATPDLNGANGVDPADLSIWLDLYFRGGGCTAGDLNGSGALDPGDLSMWLALQFAGNSVQSCQGASCP